MIYELWDEMSGNRIDGGEGEDGLRRLLKIAGELNHDQRGVPPRLFIEVWPSPFDRNEPLAVLKVGYTPTFTPY